MLFRNVEFRLISINLLKNIRLMIILNHISSLNKNTNNVFINPFVISPQDLQKYNPHMQLEIIELFKTQQF